MGSLDDLQPTRGQTRRPVPTMRTSDKLAIGSHRSNISGWVNFFGTIFRGLSLGSILLVVALGLAITFGLMGVINMAHGEMIAVGAYTSYVVQNIFGAGFAFSVTCLSASRANNSRPPPARPERDRLVSSKLLSSLRFR